MIPADQSIRDRIRDELDTTFIVEAAAGTGKTTALVDRILSVLTTGRGTLAGLVAVTFTDKAAGELKLRLRTEIERGRRAAEDPVVRERLRLGVEQLEVAHIGTIHALCAELLRERPIEAGVDPLFELASEEAASRLYDRAFDAWFQRALAAPPPGVARFLRRAPEVFDRKPVPPRDALARAGWDLAEQRDATAPWRRPPFDRDARADALVDRIEDLGALAARATRPDGRVARTLRNLAEFAAAIRTRQAELGPDPDHVEARLCVLCEQDRDTWSPRDTPVEWFVRDEVTLDEVMRRRDALRDDVAAFVRDANADLAVALRDDLQAVVAAYDRLKDRAGKLDFVDLLLRVRALVREDDAVRAELQARFSHVFVDEFQDTDPLQAETLLLLTADDPDERDWRAVRPVPGKLLLVGDPKQSIYAFRRADVGTYAAVVADLLDRGAEQVHLTTSFRATPEIQGAINAAFASVMRGGSAGTQALYVPLRPWRPAVPGQPAVLALPVPRPIQRERPTVAAVGASWEVAVAAFVDWLVTKSGWTVEEDGERVPIATRHVCLLYKRFRAGGSDLTRATVKHLELRGHRVLLAGGRSFHRREEVAALRNALTAIEWPSDELSVYATLRGPLFGFSDAELVVFRADRGRLHPLRRWPDGAGPVAEALGVLGGLHYRRNRRPFAATLGELLDVTRAQASLATWASGEQALANALRVVDLARELEAGGATSFRMLVDYLDERAERGEAAEPPIVEEGVDGVRIMTVHRSKGLEFPVVILCDPAARQAGTRPQRWVDRATDLWVAKLAGLIPVELAENHDEAIERERREAVRLAYVAATRARDLLVAPVVGLGPLAWHGQAPRWLAPLTPALYPRAGDHQRPEPGPGLPVVGRSSVIGTSLPTVAPGLHRPTVGDHPVTWFDPHLLDLDDVDDRGLRWSRWLEDGGRAEESRTAYAAWRADVDHALAAGAVPTSPSTTITRLATEEAPEPAERPTIRHVGPPGERPGGPRFGRLVHAMLADLAFDADRTDVDRAATSFGRLLGAPADEVQAAGRVVHHALGDDLFRQAGAADEVHRELPVTATLHGRTTEGVVDLLFLQDGTWQVVELKTDAEWLDRVDEYQAQVDLYRQAVAQATGRPARGWLVIL